MLLKTRRQWVMLAAAFVVVLLSVSVWRFLALRESALVAQQRLGAARDAIGETMPLLASGGSGQDVAVVADQSIARLNAACAETAGAQAALQDVQGSVATLLPLLDALDRTVPAVGGKARAQADAVDVGVQLASAGSVLCEGLQPLSVLATTGDDQGGGSAADAVRSLVAARPSLVEASGRFDRLQAALDRLDESSLDDGTRRQVASLRERLPALSQSLRDTATLLGLLGADGPRRYLLVSQNPDELRPTGGYIGSAGVVEVRDGAVKLLEYGSSRLYDTPYDLRVAPPAEFSRYLGQGYWHLAAGNWRPDFPTSASLLAQFYALARPGQHVDGVVALDQGGMALLLEAVGPVEVPEYGETVDATTLQAKLDQYVHAGDWRDEFGRKQFTAALASAVLERSLHAPKSALPGLVKAVRTAFEGEHLIVSVQDSAEAAVLADRRWDGGLLRLPDGRGDSLLLTDTEVTASKHSQVVNRDAVYDVLLDAPDGPRARLKVTYSNTSDRNQRPNVRFVPDYRTLVQAYVPAGATLLSADGFVEAASPRVECGQTVFGGEVSVPAGTSQTVTLEYRLPASVLVDGAYELLLQQQPGAPPGFTRVTTSTAAGVQARTEALNAAGKHSHWRQKSAAESPDQAFDWLPLPKPAPSSACPVATLAVEKLSSPAFLEIPAARIAAPVVELGVHPDGVMEAPATPDVVGWYGTSARAGAPGNSVMSGHVDWGRNTAVFWGLRTLQEGDQVIVRGADGVSHTYAVETNRVVPAYGGPVESLVGGTEAPILTLITCDGVYDPTRQDYSDRRVVQARLVASG